MVLHLSRLALSAVLAIACIIGTSVAVIAGDSVPAAATATPIEPANSGEIKAAFESAKELGTTEAWNAFLGAYATGFYADLARAYLKKVEAPQAGDVPSPGPPALPPSSARAGERSCSERKTLRSQHSREPTKITFVNNSGMHRAIMWIDFDGTLKDYGGLNSGEQLALDTYRTHPWMIATGPGDCLQIFLPAAEPATVELMRLAADDAPAREEKATEKRAEKSKPAPQKLKCGENYKLKNGQCVLLQNCGKNAYRSAEGDCYCKKGYVMRNGKCQWPEDKNGFEIAPWKKGGCSGWQAQCSQGNGAACGKYEENCQVN